jgi:hypothetical protein
MNSLPLERAVIQGYGAVTVYDTGFYGNRIETDATLDLLENGDVKYVRDGITTIYKAAYVMWYELKN